MASSIPLPALAIQPPRQTDVAQNLSQMVNLANAMRQAQFQAQMQPPQLQQQQRAVQLQAQQLRDVQAGQDAYSEWDPTSGYSGLASLIIKAAGRVALLS